ncbi:hypothetical protein Tco_0960095 [Tanacetum coccineum]
MNTRYINILSQVFLSLETSQIQESTPCYDIGYTTEAKDKSEGKRLEDVSIFRDFPEVSPEDLLGIPPARQVEFQIDLVPGVAPVEQASYQLAPSKMKELAKQLQELSTKDL